MATFKIILDKYKRRDDKQAIQLRIIINRRSIVRTTGFAVKAKDWDSAKERVRSSHTNHVAINDALRRLVDDAEKEYAETVAEGFRADAMDVADKTFSTHDFHEHARAYIESLTGETQWRTQKGYRSTAKAIKTYAPRLTIEQISPAFIRGYRKWLETTPRSDTDPTPLGRTSVIKRLDQFRALYNLSPHKRSPSPFESVEIGESRPAELETLTEDEIGAIWDYEPESRTEALAKDLFLFSYYALGMRSGDVLLLKWSDLRPKAIRYYQSKKEHQDAAPLEVPRNKYLDEIIGRWPKHNEYIFGLINATERRAIMRQVESRQSWLNPTLKQIALKTGIEKWISMKLARTTFARIANAKTGGRLRLVKEAMAHENIKTTSGYVGRDYEAIRNVAEAVYG